MSTEYIENNRKDVISHSKYNTKEKFIEAITKGECKIKSQNIIDKLIKYQLKEYCCENCGISIWNDKHIRLELHHKNGDHDDNQLDNLQLLCPNCHSQTDNFRALNISKNKSDKNDLKYKRKYKKKLCPICHINHIYEKSSMCRECYVKSVKNENFDDDNIVKIGNNYKDLCPICNVNYKSITSEMCNECRFEKRSIPKISKEELASLVSEMSLSNIAKKCNVSVKTVRRWCKKYDIPFKNKNMKANETN